MTVGGLKLSAASVALLVIQITLVGSIAAKYAWQRATCPRVWTRAAMYDPDLFMRGRYLSMQLTVDGCAGMQSLAGLQTNGTPRIGKSMVAPPNFVQFSVKLAVENNKLVGVRLPDSADAPAGQYLLERAGAACDQMTLQQPVDFYIAEHAQSPLPVTAGQQLWVEVTVPPKGPPRPIQLALKTADGAWKPLAFQ